MRFPEICPGPGDRTFHHLPEAYGPQAVGNAAPLKSTRQPCSAFLPNISNRFARGILLDLLYPSKILTRSFRMLQVPKLFVGTCCSSLAHQDTSKVASMMDGWMFVPIPDTEKTRTAPLLWFEILIIHWWFNYFPWPGTSKFWVVEEAMTSQSSTTLSPHHAWLPTSASRVSGYPRAQPFPLRRSRWRIYPHTIGILKEMTHGKADLNVACTGGFGKKKWTLGKCYLKRHVQSYPYV